MLHLQSETIKEDAIIGYLKALHRQVPGRIVLFWDGLTSHHSAKVQDYLATNTDWLEVVRFPGYAPELNPIEYFWSAIKGKPLANLAPDRIHELQDAIERAERRARKQTQMLQEFLVASSLYKKEMFVNISGESQ